VTTEATLWTGGRILTMDPARPTVDALCVVGERIVAVSADAHREAAARRAMVVDLTGRTLVPGFIDAHTHLSVEALHPRWADCSQAHDPESLGRVLAAQAVAESEATWVRGVGWTDLGTGFVPRRAELDALGLDRPVIVVHYSYHQAVVSSAGLEALGIGRTTPDPPGGHIERDARGEPTGLLVERAFSRANAISMAAYRDPDRWDDLCVAAARARLAEGITAVHDAACPPWAEEGYRRLARAGRLPLSVLVMPHPEALLAPLEVSRLDGPVTGEGDERVRVGAVKLFADGGVLPAMGGHVGGRPFSLGLIFDDLADAVGTVVRRGFRVAVHAIGNRGIDAALDAFAAATRAAPDDDHRFRVEHASLVHRRHPARMAALGAVAVVQPGFLHHMGGAVGDFRLDEASWMPFAALADAGVPLAASSDSPCALWAPLLTSAIGVLRRTSTGGVLDPDQSLPFETWLEAYTSGAAFAGGQEHERGRLRPGLIADLVVLDGPLDAHDPPQVAETWVRGRRVFRRDGQEEPGRG